MARGRGAIRGWLIPSPANPREERRAPATAASSGPVLRPGGDGTTAGKIATIAWHITRLIYPGKGTVMHRFDSLLDSPAAAVRRRRIEDHREVWPVRVMCDALGVSPSGFYV